MKRFTLTLTFDATEEFLAERLEEDEQAGEIPWAASRFLRILDAMRDGDPTDLFECVSVEEFTEEECPHKHVQRYPDGRRPTCRGCGRPWAEAQREITARLRARREAREAQDDDERGTGPNRYPLILRDAQGNPTDVG